MVDSDTVHVERDGRVAHLVIDRPDRLNALNVETLEALRAGIDEIEAGEVGEASDTGGETTDAERDADDPRAILLRGAGEEAFVAGADISYMRDLDTPEAQAYAELGHDVARRLETSSLPVVAAVDGYAFGGGAELALACDVRVASERTVIGQTEIDLGIVPGWGGTQRLPRLVSDETARRMILLGQRLDAETAGETGVVGEVVAVEAFDERVRKLAARLADQPQFALAAAKEAINQAHEQGLYAGLAHERRAWAGLFGTRDQREGMDAFLADRDPDFE